MSEQAKQVVSLVSDLGERKAEVFDDGVLCGGRVSAGEAELDGAEGDDESAEDDGDGGVPDDGAGGGFVHEAGLPRPHPHAVPAAGVQEGLPQPAVLAAALIPSETHPPSSLLIFSKDFNLIDFRSESNMLVVVVVYLF